MVDFGRSYAEIMMRFRHYTLMQQAAIAGVLVLLISIPYSYFLLKMNIVASISMAAYSTVLFVVVYYLTSKFITKKSQQIARQSAGPKKGLRNK